MSMKTLNKLSGVPRIVEVGKHKAELTPLPYIELQAHLTNASMNGDSFFVLEQPRILSKVLTNLEGPDVPKNLQKVPMVVGGKRRMVVPIEHLDACPKDIQDDVFVALAELHVFTESEKKS